MKIGFSTILAVLLAILALAGYITHPGVTSLITGLLALLVGLMVFGIIRSKNEESGTRVLNGIIWAVAVLVMVNQLGWLGGAATPALDTSSSTTEQVATQPGAKAAILKLNVKNGTGVTYSGAGTVYALHPGVVNNRNDLMKMIQEGRTGDLTPNSMTLASGVLSFNGYSGKIGDTVTFAGYHDATPGAGENVSFVITSKITGLSAGSTPEWMISDPQYVWYNYPTLLYYNYADTAVTQYHEAEASAVEKTLTFSMYPTNNGERWTDAMLWVEAPESSIAAIKQVKITPETGTPVTYSGVPQEVTSGENLFRAVPAVTNGTNKVFKVGAFPADGLVRTSSTQKGRQTVEVTYDHPASGDVYFYFKTTSNSNALTSTGGHFDSPATNMLLMMNTTGTDAWT